MTKIRKRKNYLSLLLRLSMATVSPLTALAAEPSPDMISVEETSDSTFPEETSAEDITASETEMNVVPKEETADITTDERTGTSSDTAVTVSEEDSISAMSENAPLSVGETFTIDEISYTVTSTTTPYTVEVSDVSLFLEGELVIPASITNDNVSYEVKSIAGGSCQGLYHLTSITISEGVETMGDSTFFNCYNVTKISLPSTLQTFTLGGFAALETIQLSENNPYFQVVDDVLYSKDGTALWLYPSAKEDHAFAMLNTTQTIKEGAFYYNQKLTTLTMPDSVTTVEPYAFDHANGLREVVFGTNVSKCGEFNFYKCENLETLTIRGNFVFGNDCIEECPKLKKIIIDGQVHGWGAYSLYNLPSLEAYEVLSSNYYSVIDGVLFNGTKLFAYPAAKNLETYIVPDTTTAILQLAFNYMQHTTTIILPPNVYLNTWAFSNPNPISPISIYFRDTESVSLSTSKSGVFSSLTDGSKIYGRNQAVVDSILSYTKAIADSDSVSVEVGVIPSTSISLDQTAADVTIGNTVTLSATTKPYYNTDTISFQSSNTGIATVNESGVVTGVAVGTATITATTGSGKTVSCKVTVTKPIIKVTSVTLNKSTLALETGASGTLTATVAPTDATNKEVTWKSSDTSIATISNGKVTAVKAGTATITATADDGSGKSATCTVTVSDPVIQVTNVTLNQSALALETGASGTLTATIAPTNATNKAVTWKSSNTSIATVSNGKVKGVKAGTATITATADDGSGKSATCTVTVSDSIIQVTSVTLNKSTLELDTGASSTLTATIAPTNATNKAVTWKSSDTSIATVSNGKVTAVKAGTATITATADDGSGKSASCTVVVSATVSTPSFDDVSEDAWYYDSVVYVSSRGIMTGMNETTFSPNSNLSRGQFATIIYRMEGSPSVDYEPVFSDVSDGVFYSEAIIWANENDIVTGYTNGTFGPQEDITREQMATIMYRYAKFKNYDVSAYNDLSSFPDSSKVSGFANEAVCWAVGAGLISGDQGKINPRNQANRAQCATIMMRFMEYYK